MYYKSFVYYTILGLYLTLVGCSGGDSPPDQGQVSTNFPYLMATPQVSFVQNVTDTAKYDVTVTLDATGPTPIYAVGLWIQPKDNSSNFEHLELQYNGGTTWSASTMSLLPLPAGDYYIDSIMIEDADPLSKVIVKSGWYVADVFSTSNYGIDQRETNWDPTQLEILDFNAGISNIPIVNFTLP